MRIRSFLPTLAAGLRETGVQTIAAWDILFPVDDGRKLREAGERIGVRLAGSAADAARGCDIVISAVTASSSLEAAQSIKPYLDGQLYLDINSVSPAASRRPPRISTGRRATSTSPSWPRCIPRATRHPACSPGRMPRRSSLYSATLP